MTRVWGVNKGKLLTIRFLEGREKNDK